MLQQMRSAAKYLWIIIGLAFVGGFLLYETSGLLGLSTAPTATTPVATVNGTDILYRDYVARYQQEVTSAQQQQGRTLSEDEVEQIKNSVFDEMVSDVLLQQAYRKRGIDVTVDEIKEYAQFAPPPQLMQSPELQTEGQFDIQKYRRYLTSSAAKQSGLLAYLEQYYRTEIPRQKLLDQLTAGVYVTDGELWQGWRDQHDSAQVTFAAFRPTLDSAAARKISDSELKAYYEKHKDELKQNGRAVLTVVELRRQITAADSLAARQRADSVRDAILKGARFEQVAREVSADTVSGSQGGDLGRGPRGRFVKQFDDAAFALKPGELSSPVLTQFGYHIIRVDERKGDTLALHHILIRIQPSDSATAVLDARADTLTRMAASSEQGAKLDTAARKLALIEEHVVAVEGQPAQFNGHIIPSVSAWAFGGAKAGETSDLYDDENGYYLARLDSLRPGGIPPFEKVKEQVRQTVAYEQALDKLVPEAQQLAQSAVASGLQAAAAAKGVQTSQTPMFTRGSFVPGLGQFTAAIGAAFGLPEGAVSQPVKTDEAVFVLHVDRRLKADSASFEAQKEQLRQQRLQQVRNQRVQMFMQDLRESAKIVDHRKEIEAAGRRAET